MASKFDAANGVYDLSEINTLKELREEIAFLKESIKKDEEELEGRLRRLPQHAIRSAADNVLPSFLNKLIANGTWKLLLSGATMFANPFAKGFSFKKNIVSSAKRLGLITLAKTAYGYWANKKTAQGRMPAISKSGVVTTLNTGRPKKD